MQTRTVVIILGIVVFLGVVALAAGVLLFAAFSPQGKRAAASPRPAASASPTSGGAAQAEATATVEGATATASSTAGPTLTETPSTPMLTLTLNANCRRGPSQVYGVLTSLLKGQTVPILAQNQDGTWWLVRIPTGEACWIGWAVSTVAGNPTALPIATGMLGCNVAGECKIPCPKTDPKPASICTP